MKIIQIVSVLSPGDAIGNDVLAIDETLRGAGYDAVIMACSIHESLRDRGICLDFSAIGAGDLVLFHKASGDEIQQPIANLPCRKVMIYHNITPARFFLPYDAPVAWNVWRGRRQLKRYTKYMDFCWGVSNYNCQELRRVGARNISVRPVFFDLKQTEPDAAVLHRLKQEPGTKILFIGRVAPNKKHEDLIKAFYCFQKTADPEAKLYLVGGWAGMEKYYAKLKGFAADLKLTDEQVVFTGRVTEAEKEAYLRGADLLLCLSEHEGFCVPLLEAASRDLPVLAYAAGAIPETLGDNGLLVRKKDYDAIARLIQSVCTDSALRADVIEKQRNQLKRFTREQTRQTLLRLIKEAGS